MTDDDKDDMNFDDDEENNDMLESLKIKNDDDEPKQTVLEEQNEETIQPSTSTYEEDTNEIIFENIEPSDHIALYVSNPTLIKDTIGSYFNYTVQGTKVPEPIIRRFRDFDTLRSKLRLRWPGIFLPRLPHRKKFGNNEKEVVDIRVEMINAFFIKLSSLTKIFNSEEVALFIKNDSDSMKKLSELQMENYQDLFFKYAQAFPEGKNEVQWTGVYRCTWNERSTKRAFGIGEGPYGRQRCASLSKECTGRNRFSAQCRGKWRNSAS